MRLRISALLISFLALALYGTVLRRTQLEAAQEEVLSATARGERNRLRERVAVLERARLRPAREGTAETLPFRRTVVSCLQGSALAGVRIDTHATSEGLALTLTGTGSLKEALRVLRSLLARGIGVVPVHVRFAPVAEGVSFTLDGER
jgi:hypothetical protein